MTKAASAIVAAAMAWAQADEQRRHAARVKRQVRDRVKAEPGMRLTVRLAAERAADRMLEKARREERDARRTLLKACNPTPVTLKAANAARRAQATSLLPERSDLAPHMQPGRDTHSNLGGRCPQIFPTST